MDNENINIEKILEENRRLKDKLIVYERKLDQVVKKNPLAYIEWGRDLCVREWNPAAEFIFEYAEEEVLGKHAFDIIVPDDEKDLVGKVWTELIQQRGNTRGTNINLTKSGRRIICRWYNIHLINKNGNVTGIVSFVQDITKRKMNEKELILAKQKAEEADNMKTDFLANMSHEIRTPMNGILGFAELLKDSGITEKKRQEYVGLINNSGKHLLNIINDIIDVSKLEAGRINVVRKECSLSVLFFELYFFFQNRNEQEKREIDLKMFKGIPDKESYIFTDITRLRQVMTNLISNAIKFTPKGGKVEFGYKKKDDDNLLFYVKDTGIGIPEEKHDVIFDRFRQADSSTTRKYGGTGLGLAISKGLVELLGGNIYVESEPKKETVFSFTLPYITPGEIGNSNNKEETVKFIGLRGKKILIVEDDENSYRFLEAILRKHKVEPVHAKDGLDAVKQAAKNKFDLVLMDMHLPGISGTEATKRIKRLRPGLPIVAQTANVMEEDREKCINAGCDEFIAKPVQRKDLLEIIDKLLRVRRVL